MALGVRVILVVNAALWFDRCCGRGCACIALADSQLIIKHCDVKPSRKALGDGAHQCQPFGAE